MTYALPVQVVIYVHDGICPAPLLDRAKLEGALAAPMQAGFGKEFFPTAVEKAAKLLSSIARAHAFRDGNKRTAWLACTTFLGAHGIEIGDDVTDEDVADIVEAIATRHYEEADLSLVVLALVTSDVAAARKILGLEDVS